MNVLDGYLMSSAESERLQRARGATAWRVFDLLKRAAIGSARRGRVPGARGPSLSQLMEMTGLSDRGVRNGLGELQELGLIRIRRHRYGGNVYELPLDGSLKPPVPPAPPLSPAASEAPGLSAAGLADRRAIAAALLAGMKQD
ncbi:MAG: hypothetical protein MI741_21610 [Rhodospirillales bacterium]|nr:hypothetical protein [Rhodospirillales bacterium]